MRPFLLLCLLATASCARAIASDGSSGAGGSGAEDDASSGTGSCDPEFCSGGCCITPNGPCGIAEGTECREQPPCDETQCPAQFGNACCTSAFGSCGVDLGLGCTPLDPEPPPQPPQPSPGDPVALYGPCGLAADEGSGDSELEMYAWVPVLRSCAPFTYKGSGGNANRFASATECLSACGTLERIAQCACTGSGAGCDAEAGCSQCPATFQVDPTIQDMTCSSLGLHCDSLQQCGIYCDCVEDGSGAAVWACASRVCG